MKMSDNKKYIDKVILPKNEECIFVDKTWRDSPAYKITKANILNWNSKLSNTLTRNDIGRKVPPLEYGQIPLQYIPSNAIGTASPATLLLIFLTSRNDEEIMLKPTVRDLSLGITEYIIEEKTLNVKGEIGNAPVKKVILDSEMFNMETNADYEIYFVADENFQGVYKKTGQLIEELEYVYTEREEYDFVFQAGHLYRIKNNKIKDCSNTDATFDNGIHEKSFYFE